MKFNLDNFLNAIECEVIGSLSNSFGKFVINSKNVESGDIFIALRGEKAHGHEFIGEALEKGASGFVVERFFEIPRNKFQVKVRNTNDFLVSLGYYARGQLHSKFVGITGSAGKTTTKEMISSVLGSKYIIASPSGNLNTDISLPLFLVNECKGKENYIILEMGIQKTGDMDRLIEIVKPDIGIVTNIGESHLEFLIDKTGVLREKFKLVDYLQKNKGSVFLNADDPLITSEITNHRVKSILYGFSDKADFKGKIISMNANSMTLSIFDKSFKFSFSGLHFAYDLLASFAVCNTLGLDLIDVYEHLKGFKPIKGRGQFIKLSSDISLIDETYNSNPLSLKNSLTRFANSEKPLVLIVGDMLELGRQGEELHYESGEFIATLNPSILITYGRLAKKIGEGASERGIKSVFSFEDKKSLLDFLKTLEIQKKSIIFVKGSRGMKMEEIVDFLKERLGNG